jgi:hypothetical protein
VTIVGALPVIAVAGSALVAGLVVGVALDKIDERLGIERWLQQMALDLEAEVVEAVRVPFREFLLQMDWCVRYPFRCFGY